MSVNISVNISDRLNERLARLAPQVSGLPVRQECALSGQCPDCAAHKGVVLEAGSSTVKASLCACVKNCTLCAASCLKPVGNNVSPCATPSPRKVIGLINEARIPVRYLDADLSKFDGFSPTDRTQKTTLQNWIRGIQPGKSSGLLLSGPVGMGKSWFLAAVAKQLAFQGISVRYTDFFQLVHELREAYANDLSDKASLKPLQSVDVLIIDELGKGRNSEWELSVADSLISERYNGNKCIIAATNYPLHSAPDDNQKRQIDYLRADHSNTNQMNTVAFEPLSQRIGARMFSRLSENCICMPVSGVDRRRR
jgi:DNA replication protein DnaC